MTTILQRAKDLAVDVSTFGSIKANAKQAEQFAVRARQLSEESSKLEGLRKLESLFIAAQICRASKPAPLTLRTKLASVIADYTQVPESLINSSTPLQHSVLGPLAAFREALATSLKEAWSDHLSTISTRVPDRLMDVLSEIPTLSEQTNKIRLAQNIIDSVAETLPGSNEESISAAVAQVRTAELAKSEAVDKLKGIPEAVHAFLVKLNNGQANLGDLSPDVLRWLTNERLLSLFKISWARAKQG